MTIPLPAAIAAAAVAAAPFVLPPSYVTLGVYIGLGALVALGLALATGVAGLTSFGQAAFVGLGAYCTAWLSTAQGWPPLAGLAAGLIATALLAWALGLITLRLSGHFLPIGTIAWGLGLFYVFANLKALGGYNGISGIPPLAAAGHAFGPAAMYGLAWALVAAALAGAAWLLDSRTGRALRSLRGGAQMAEAFGVDTARVKTQVFVHAALLAALSGWLYAHFMRFIDPTPFGLRASIEYLFMSVLGGAASLWGALAGAAALTVLNQWVRDLLPGLTGKTGYYEMFAFGVVMVLVLLFARQGIVPLLARRFARPASRPVPQALPLPARARPAAGTPLLAASGLRKEFGGLVAVADLSFEVRSGEVLGLIGPNGAGKSTAFNLITGLLPATRGRVSVLGRDVSRLPARERCALGMARSFQHVKLRPAMSLVENVALGAHLRGRRGYLASMLRLDREEEARLLAEAARQLARAGIEGDPWRPAGTLPLGQQRLLEVARALAADPLLLLLDEPAAGLRYAEKEALAELLRRLRGEGLTILLVEHDMQFLMGLADRVVVMNFGQKIAEGTPAEVQADPAVIDAYLGSDL